MADKKDYAFAANCIGVMLLILKDKYSDAEIKKMLQAKKITGMLNALGDKKLSGKKD